MGEREQSNRVEESVFSNEHAGCECWCHWLYLALLRSWVLGVTIQHSSSLIKGLAFFPPSPSFLVPRHTHRYTHTHAPLHLSPSSLLFIFAFSLLYLMCSHYLHPRRRIQHFNLGSVYMTSALSPVHKPWPKEWTHTRAHTFTHSVHNHLNCTANLFLLNISCLLQFMHNNAIRFA